MDQTQNPTSTDPTVSASPAPVDPSATPAAPLPEQAAPADPMDQAGQIPAMPTAPINATDPVATVNPVPDPMSATVSADPAMAPAPLPGQATSEVTSVTPDMNIQPATTVPAATGPVTNEELMEELQRIQDRLDEMDEKL